MLETPSIAANPISMLSMRAPSMTAQFMNLPAKIIQSITEFIDNNEYDKTITHFNTRVTMYLYSLV